MVHTYLCCKNSIGIHLRYLICHSQSKKKKKREGNKREQNELIVTFIFTVFYFYCILSNALFKIEKSYKQARITVLFSIECYKEIILNPPFTKQQKNSSVDENFSPKSLQ